MSRLLTFTRYIQTTPFLGGVGSNQKHFEVIITNAYHGLYWSTLLGKRVICIRNKSGLFTLKYKPVYLSKGSFINNELISKANTYNHALEECRSKNIDFYNLIKKNFF